jgi:putative photosynthetic complex assembly protein
MKRSRPVETVPRKAIIAAGLLVGFSLTIVTAARLTGYKWEWKQEGQVVATRAIDFKQAGNGDVEVTDAVSGEILGRYSFTENAFMRTVMLGLHKERAIVSEKRDAPFNIEKWNDGRVTVADPVSGRYFEMAAFGHHQVETFAAFLN